MNPHRPRAAIYARFSTDLQNARSAEDQARVCREHAERADYDVVEIYSDLAISGTNNNRPGLNALLAAAEARSFDVVVAEALDRVARDQADIATIYKRLEFAGIKLVTVSEGAISELHIGMLGTMNAIFVKELGNKIRRGQKGNVARGRVPGGLCYGHEPAPVLLPDGTVERGHRRIVEAEAVIIRRIFAEYLTDASPKAIAHQLNREGVPAPRGTEWRANTISGSRGRQNGILGNPLYTGQIVHNRVRMVKNPETRRRVSRVNASTEIVTGDAPDLRIIDQESWDAVQRRREERANTPFSRQVRPKHIFSGIVRCGECGGTYTIVSKDRWACSRHRESGTCPNPRRISTRRLEERVLAGLKNKLLAPDVIEAVVKAYQATRARKRSEMQAGLRAAETRVDALKGEIARLVDAVAAGADFAEIREGIASRREDLAIAEAQLAEHEALPPLILHPQIVTAYRRRVESLAEALTQGTQARKHLSAIRALVESILVNDAPAEPDRASIEVTGSLATALAIATGEAPPRKIEEARRLGANRTVRLVAEEGLEPPTRGL